MRHLFSLASIFTLVLSVSGEAKCQRYPLLQAPSQRPSISAGAISLDYNTSDQTITIEGYIYTTAYLVPYGYTNCGVVLNIGTPNLRYSGTSLPGNTFGYGIGQFIPNSPIPYAYSYSVTVAVPYDYYYQYGYIPGNQMTAYLYLTDNNGNALTGQCIDCVTFIFNTSDKSFVASSYMEYYSQIPNYGPGLNIMKPISKRSQLPSGNSVMAR